MEILKVKARITLYKEANCRKTPFSSGYRPLFHFTQIMGTSGQITLIDRDLFYPGDEAIVQLVFMKSSLLGDDFGIGKKFTFDEGRNAIGEGEIVEML